VRQRRLHLVATERDERIHVTDATGCDRYGHLTSPGYRRRAIDKAVVLDGIEGLRFDFLHGFSPGGLLVQQV